MRRVLLTLAAAVLLVARTPLIAEDFVSGRFGEYLESLRIQTGIPGLAAAVVGRNGVQWDRGFGFQDVDRGVVMRSDTPMHLDGLTEIFTASLVMRCVEEGRLSMDDVMRRFKATSPDPNATLKQVLTYTVDGSYSYRPDRLDSGLAAAIRTCTSDSFRETLANLLDRNGMADSVPGPDVGFLVPPAEGVLTPEFNRYNRILDRLATPYAVDGQRRAVRTSYAANTLTPTGGLISTVLDYAKFDVSLRNGQIMTTDTLAMAWQNSAGGPHGIGWFVQNYNGEKVIWQFGSTDSGSSSMVITLPSRSVSVILVANSNGLTKGFNLSAGDILASPFARAFLGLFAI